MAFFSTIVGHVAAHGTVQVPTDLPEHRAFLLRSTRTHAAVQALAHPSCLSTAFLLVIAWVQLYILTRQYGANLLPDARR